MDIAEKLHQLMLRPGFQAREDQETLLDGKKEIERLRAALKDIQKEAMALHPPRPTWYYDRAQNALTNSTEPLVRDGLAPPTRS